MSISELSKLSQVAQAAYASFPSGATAGQLANALQEQDAAFTATQAQHFAAEYSVVLQYNDDASPLVSNGTGLSLTVFKDNATNQLTLAIRGTEGFLAVGLDWTTANNSIVTGGTGYAQIVALYNWWLRATASEDSFVPQYDVTLTSSGGLALVNMPGTGSLVRKADAAATGELRSALVDDPDQRLDVTGHSLGGHLAMAFAALFGASAASVTSFNAPGFRDTTTNHAFFAQLGGVLPTKDSIGAKTVNVIADQVRQDDVGRSPIAGLWSRPGSAVDVPIENQWLSMYSMETHPGEQFPGPYRALQAAEFGDGLSFGARQTARDVANARPRAERDQ